MAFQTLTHQFMQIPAVSRTYISACLLTTAAVVSKILFLMMMCFLIFLLYLFKAT